MESFLRHQTIFKEKGDPNNEKHKQTYQENVEKERVALKAVQDLLSSFLPTLEAMGPEGQELAKELGEVIHESGKEYDSK